MTERFAPGTKVTCRYRGAIIGTVLADDDPRAWAGTFVFPSPDPDPHAVRAHVASCTSLGIVNREQQPVLWAFGIAWWDSELATLEAVPEVLDDAIPEYYEEYSTV